MPLEPLEFTPNRGLQIASQTDEQSPGTLSVSRIFYWTRACTFLPGLYWYLTLIMKLEILTREEVRLAENYYALEKQHSQVKLLSIFIQRKAGFF